jgi:hypothetical protein
MMKDEGEDEFKPKIHRAKIQTTTHPAMFQSSFFKMFANARAKIIFWSKF